MTYNNFQEFEAALKKQIILAYVKNVANASFQLKEGGFVLVYFSLRMPERSIMDQPFFKLEVHILFAWALYLLMSNHNARYV